MMTEKDRHLKTEGIAKRGRRRRGQSRKTRIGSRVLRLESLERRRVMATVVLPMPTSPFIVDPFVDELVIPTALAPGWRRPDGSLVPNDEDAWSVRETHFAGATPTDDPVRPYISPPGPGVNQQDAIGFIPEIPGVSLQHDGQHQVWPNAAGQNSERLVGVEGGPYPDPILYHIRAQVAEHSFTSSRVVPITAAGTPVPAENLPPGITLDEDGTAALPNSTVYAFNGTFPGPMINAEYGKPVLVRFENDLDLNPLGLDRQDFGDPEWKSLTHLHNGHTAPESDGNPFYMQQNGGGYLPGQWSDNLYLNYPAGGDPAEKQSFFWFHDHVMHHTGEDVYKGTAGLFPIYDPKLDPGDERDPGAEGNALHLPGIKTVHDDGSFDVKYDIPMAFYDTQLDDGATVHHCVHGGAPHHECHVPDHQTHPEWWGKTFFAHDPDRGFVGDIFTVNGKAFPVLHVSQRQYRFRFLDASVSREYELALMTSDAGPVARPGTQGQWQIPDGELWQPMTQIASMGGLLPEPIQRDSVQIWPATRNEHIVDFGDAPAGTVIYLTNILEMPDGRKPNFNDPGTPINELLYKVPLVKIIVDGPPPPGEEGPDTVPATLRPMPALPSGAELAALPHPEFTLARSGRLGSENQWLINDTPFDFLAPLYTVTRGQPEIWTVTNGGGGWVHPMHMHQEEHTVLSRTQSTNPHPDDTGKSDVVNLDENESVSFYRNFRTFTGRYVGHCHNLLHEDHSMMFGWTIQEGPPVLDPIANQTLAEETTLSFTATASDPDVPLQTLTFSLSGAPAGASISSGGVFSWTPTEAQGPASYTFDVVVTDGALTDAETVSVTVNEVNRAPVLGAIGDLTVDEETALSFIATASDPDVPLQTLMFSLSGAPAGASISSGGVFNWTPSEAQGPASYTFDLLVTDGLLTHSEPITVTVNEVNLAPVVGAIGILTVDEETALSFAATANDPDVPLQTLTFGLSGAPAGASISSGGEFNWTPTDAQGPGTFTFDVVVTDGALTDSETVTVTVTVNGIIVGTGGNDNFVVNIGLVDVTVTLNSVLVATVPVGSAVVLDGGLGTDTVTVQDATGLSNTLRIGNGTVAMGTSSATWVNMELSVAAGLAGNDTFAINGPSGTIALLGGDDNDTFVFANGASTGAIQGGNGDDKLDYSAYATPVSVNLNTGTATGTTGISSIRDVMGGSGADTIVADSQNNVMSGGGGSDTITGGLGNDTLIESGSGNYTLSNATLVNGPSTDSLSGIEVAQLTSNSAGAVFAVGGWTGTGSLTDSAGGGTIQVSRGANMTLTDAQLTIGSTQILTLSGISHAYLTGNSASHVYTLSDWTGTAHIDAEGVDGSDKLVVTQDASSFTLGPSSLVVTGGPSVTFTLLEIVELKGGAGSNTFNVIGYQGKGKIMGEGASDTLNVSGMPSPTTLTLTNTSLKAGGQTLTLASLESANLSGGAGNDVFTVGGWTGGGALSGGGGANSVVATKNFNFTLTDALLATSDGMSLALVDIGAATLTGGASANAYTLTGWTGNATLSAAGQGAGTFDSLIYWRDASFTLSNTSLAIVPVSGVSRTWTLNGFETANLAGGTSDNTIDVSGWTNVATLSGGGGIDTIAATKNTNMTLSDSSLVAGTMNASLSGFTRSSLTANNTASRSVNASSFTGNSVLTATGTAYVKMFGGVGNDVLRVLGNGGAALVGNAGADTLNALGNGRTILIGGDGLDTLTTTGGSGGTGQAALISGRTAYDADLVALDALFAEWGSANSYASRIANLTAGTGLAAGRALNALTVFDDLQVNDLTNSAATDAGQAWFVVRSRDNVSRRPNDVRTNL